MNEVLPLVIAVVFSSIGISLMVARKASRNKKSIDVKSIDALESLLLVAAPLFPMAVIVMNDLAEDLFLIAFIVIIMVWMITWVFVIEKPIDFKSQRTCTVLVTWSMLLVGGIWLYSYFSST